jgi:hypothetical protein
VSGLQAIINRDKDHSQTERVEHLTQVFFCDEAVVVLVNEGERLRYEQVILETFDSIDTKAHDVADAAQDKPP